MSSVTRNLKRKRKSKRLRISEEIFFIENKTHFWYILPVISKIRKRWKIYIVRNKEYSNLPREHRECSYFFLFSRRGIEHVQNVEVFCFWKVRNMFHNTRPIIIVRFVYCSCSIIMFCEKSKVIYM